jgi:hypothetical protein
MKIIRWIIFCGITGLSGGRAFLAMTGTISALRWNPEIIAAFNMTPLQFGAFGFGVTIFWGVIAIVSWILRKAKDTPRTPLQNFLTPLFLTVWVVGVLFLIGYDQKLRNEGIKVMVGRLLGQ